MVHFVYENRVISKREMTIIPSKGDEVRFAKENRGGIPQFLVVDKFVWPMDEEHRVNIGLADVGPDEVIDDW